MASQLEIKNLHVSVEGKEILKGLNLTISQGETHALMGPNGSGKSTLAYTLSGHPKYLVTDGDVLFEGESIIAMSSDERARKGVFLAFQYPVAVPGVSMANFLRLAYRSVKGDSSQPESRREEVLSIPKFRKLMREKMAMLKMDESFATRYLNDGFSGGEKKRAEILQMAILEPKIAILDETDSGLDIDALRIVSDGVNLLKGPNLGLLVITHYNRILNYIKPDIVHVLVDGAIQRSGGPELALQLEETGYESVVR
ncbi:MAG: Fe-S cluster assembly ATPase SufC [Chloroflexi bacterium]|nr:Fe-S cluster assembly ATPase SufC [Chloroflexota bacterium]